MSIALQAPDRPAAWIIGTHLIAHSLIQSTAMAMATVAPVLAIKQFGANEWQSLVLTASPTVFFSLSIFWNDLFQRLAFGRYLWLYWIVACLPIGLCGLTGGYWTMMPLFLVGCAGGSAYYPASGELYKALYPEALRGRLYSIIWGGSTAITAGIALGVGEWLNADGEAYRYFFPACAAAQGAGIALLLLLSRWTGHASARVVSRVDPFELRRVFEPVGHMKEVLKTDPIFARYEAAYMTYGVGWMIVYALLPPLVTKGMHLDYDQIALSKEVAYLLAVVVMIYPAGVLMDKVGPILSTGLSFALLTLHPLGLMWAHDTVSLSVVSVVYGMAHAGANVGWMMGPVALAPSPEKVPQYVAIHATLVGIRGKLFQFAGVGLYWLTASFYPPLAIAAAAYAWAGWQMWRLNGRVVAAAKERAERAGTLTGADGASAAAAAAAASVPSRHAEHDQVVRAGVDVGRGSVAATRD